MFCCDLCNAVFLLVVLNFAVTSVFCQNHSHSACKAHKIVCGFSSDSTSHNGLRPRTSLAVEVGQEHPTHTSGPPRGCPKTLDRRDCNITVVNHVQEYSPEEKVMRLVKTIIAQRGVLVQDLVRGCLGSTDDLPVESPGNFMIWEEVC